MRYGRILYSMTRTHVFLFYAFSVVGFGPKLLAAVTTFQPFSAFRILAEDLDPTVRRSIPNILHPSLRASYLVCEHHSVWVWSFSTSRLSLIGSKMLL